MATTDATAGGPPTPERIMQFGFGYAAPLLIEAGVRLGFFDALADGPAGLEDIVAKSGAAPRGARAALNGLVGLGLLARDGQGRYTLTPESETYLVSRERRYLGGFFRHTSSQLIPKWLQLTESVRTGKPAAAVNQQGDGTAFFLEFVEDLYPMNYATARKLGEALGLARATGPVRVLDLAAGSGVWSIALAHLSPQVRVTAVDWEGVLPATRRTAERQGVLDRFAFVAGDLRDADVGSGHNVATLGHILHSEGAERSRALLKKTFAALAPGGTIAIAEWLVNDDRTGPTAGLIFGVNMLVNTDEGDTFSFEEIRGWLEEAGFRDVRLLDVPGPSPLVLATKPGA